VKLPGKPFRRLCEDTVGAMVIETALIAPVLALLALGTFDVGRMVSRQQELQHAATQAEQIVLALPAPDDLDKDQIETVIRASTGLEDAEIDLVHKHRCGVAPLQAGTGGCAAGVQHSKFIEVRISEISQPFWTAFGVGGPITHTVNRTVQVG
jgi:uncharacterized membrane protein